MKFQWTAAVLVCLVSENQALIPWRSPTSLLHSRHMTWHRNLPSSSPPLSMSALIQDSNLKSSVNNDDETESMQKSIESMREEARKRLEALSKEMSDYQVEIQSHAPSSTTLTSTSTSPRPESSTQSDPSPETQPLGAASQPIPFDDLGKNGKEKTIDAPSKIQTVDLAQQVQVPHADAHCLEDTRWKIVFDLGREPGTWMPKTWGASGDRLRFSVIVDLTETQFYGREEFFDGLAGARELKVVEATLGPSYWGSQNHGQEQLKVAPKGGYKVVRGAGPMGTDTLRFFIEIEQDIVQSKKSDVVCPAGRIYGNCGYFPIWDTLSKDHHMNMKEALQKEYKKVSRRYKDLVQESEEDTRLFSMDHLSRAKDMMQTRNLMKRLEQRIQEARQREPDRAQLRLSRRGDVGLSKEGGVCLKVQKGLALEYHILGRMELASVQKELPDNHEEFEDLVHKLQP